MATYYQKASEQDGVNVATVHLGSCKHCNNGQGRKGGGRKAAEGWVGPFDHFEDASTYGKLASPIVTSCKDCNPSK